MKLTGLLLGAGASYDVAMPLAWELTGELKRWLTSDKLEELNGGWRAHGLGYSDEVISTLSTALTVESMTYEHIMGNLQVHDSRYGDPGYHGLFAFLSEIVYALLKERHVLNIGLIERSISYLAGIATLAEINSPLWVYSLNHDLIIECFSAHSGVPIKSGYSDEMIPLPQRNVAGDQIGELKGRVLSRSQLATGQTDFFNLGEHGINLLKIHGSLDEFIFNDDQDLLKLVPIDNTVRGVIETLQIANEYLRYVDPGFPDGYAVALNEIAYADADGEMQFLRRTPLAGVFKFQNQSSQTVPNELLALFEGRLLYLTTLVCVGYGFADQHVNQAIRSWLELSDDKHLTIVDPTITCIPAMFLHLHPQIDLIKSSATEYFDQVSGVTRSRRETIELSFGSRMRQNKDAVGPMWDRFLDQRTADLVDQSIEWAKMLPWRDGDIDIEAMGLTDEELIELFKQQVALPSVDDVLEDFLRHATGQGG